MKEHDIRTVKRRQLKFDDSIIGSFCKAFYTHDENITQKATSYHKFKFKKETQDIHYPIFHIYFSDKDALICRGFRETLNLMNRYDLKTFRTKLDKQNANRNKWKKTKR
jgi:hypothetical protein